MLNLKWVWPALVAVAVVWNPSVVNAQTISLNTASGDWNNPSSWTPAVIPAASDDVILNFSTSATLTVIGSQSCHSITIGGGSASQLLDISGSLNIGTGGTINALGTIMVEYSGTLTGAGTLTNSSGTLTMSGGTLSVTTVNNDSICGFSGSISIVNLTNITLNNTGAVTWDSSENLSLTNAIINNNSGGIFNINNNQSIASTGTCAIVNNGSIEKSNSSTGLTSFDSNTAVTNNDAIVISAGNTLELGNLTNYNAGNGTFTGGSYFLDGVLELLNGGVIATNSAVIDLSSSSAGIQDSDHISMLTALQNNAAGASISLSGGAVLSSAATNAFTCDGSIFINTGCTFSTGSEALNISSSGIISSGGGSIFAGGGINVQGGTLIGSGSISGDLNNNGFVAAGASGQTLSVSGNYTQTSSATFIAEVASPSNPGTLSISGTAMLSGAVEPIVDYTAATGDTLRIMTFASATGQFSSVLPDVTDNGLVINLAPDASGVSLTIGGPAPTAPPTIISASADNSSVATNVTVTFTGVAVDPSNYPLTYTWDFGDGSADATGSTVTHAFTEEATWTVTLTVSNGFTSAVATVPVMALAPNSGGAGIPNLGDGGSVANPLNGFSIMLVKSDGGLCQFQIDIDALIRSAFSVSTAFDSIGGRSTTVTGLTPAFKADTSGIYIATSTATDSTTNQVAGKGRKTIGMSGAEVGEAPKVKTPPKNHQIVNGTTKGKFIFGKPTGATKPTPDTVSFSGSFELPEGLDLSKTSTQNFQFSIGNIMDSVTINAKGKMVGASTMGRIKKLAVIFPHLPKGQTTTAAGQMAKFSVTISQTGLSASGFDTEGITGTYATSEKSLKSVKRSIQVAMVFAGVVWQATAPVTYTLSPKGDSGVISGRSGL